MHQCDYIILENIYFVVVRRQTDFFNVDSHRIMFVRSYTSHLPSARQTGPENTARTAFSEQGTSLCLLRYSFPYRRPPTPNTFSVEDR